MIGVPPLAPPLLRFEALDASASRRSATPTVLLPLRVHTDDERAIRSLTLTVRVDIAAERRRYTALESERLGELFGSVEDWGRSLGAVNWLNATINVGPFAGETTIDVALPCTYDFEVAHAKYLAALDGGGIPVDILPSGTIFYAGEQERLQAARLSWDANVSSRIPVSVWREAVNRAFPDTAWLRVASPVFGKLQAFRARERFTSWEETFAALLERSER